MAQEMYKHDAMLHMVWTIACADKWKRLKPSDPGYLSQTEYPPDDEKLVTPEEDSYLDTIRKKEGININWNDFNAKRKELGSHEVIIDEACKALRGCGKDWKIKSLGYMIRMAFVSHENDLENNMSDKEWELVLRAQRELGLTDDERNNSWKGLPGR